MSGTEPGRSRGARWLSAAWPELLLVALVALVFADPLFTGRVFFFRDLGTAVHPVLVEARTAPDGGVDALPFWSNHLSNGRPLLANPGYALLHPFNLLYLVLPFDAAFNLFIVLHVLVAGVGMSLLARAAGASDVARFAAGAGFALGGYVTSVTSLYPTIATAAWAPLVLLAGLHAMKAATARRLGLFAVALAVMALGGQPEPVLLTLVVGAAWSLVAAEGTFARRALRVAGTWGVGGAWALALAAPQVVPTALLARQSLRSLGFTPQALLYNSVHPLRLLGVVVPRYGGHPLEPERGASWRALVDAGSPYFPSMYAGVTVVLLAAAALFLVMRRRAAAAPGHRIERAAIVLASVAALGLVLSLGRHLPGAETLVALVPWAVPFRYPEKLVFLPALVLPLLAAAGLDAVAGRLPRRLRAVAPLLAALVVADLALVHRGYAPTESSAERRSRPDLTLRMEEAARAHGLEDGTWRVYHERRESAWRAPARPGGWSQASLHAWQRSVLVPATGAAFGARYAFERAGDQLDLVDYFRLAREIHQQRWPERSRELGRAGVLWVVSPDGRLAEKSAGMLVRVERLDRSSKPLPRSGWLYRNEAFVPRARVEGASGRARVVSETHRGLVVAVEADAPARLVLSDALAPGWTARLDGEDVPIEREGGAFRSVSVPAGAHEVRFSYRPPGLLAGLALALVGLVALAWAMLPRPRA